MVSHATRRFWKAFDKLHEEIQRRARHAFKLFQQDPHHPSLQFKQVHQMRPVYSARVSLGYRALGVREGDVVIWFWIGTHDDYERLIKEI